MLSREVYDAAYRSFLTKLRQARLEAHMTQEEVARLLGRPQSFVSKAESGERRIDVVELDFLARLYGKDLAYFAAQHDVEHEIQRESSGLKSRPS